ncbi:MAG: hypothetical protein FJW39_08095 [Acidobacteria bacterium]|nr:hypothetical protein [Acidobacteriota bacterium]
MKATIRWESALPMYDAMRKQRTPESAHVYVISVTGLRLGGPPRGGPGEDKGPGKGGNPQDRRRAMLAMMKQSAALERKGKDPIHAELAEWMETAQGPVLMFGFPRASQPIDLADKEVTFHCKAGPMDLKAKFALKDMVYRGKLEL